MTSRNALRRLVLLLLLALSAAGCHESKDRSLSATRSSVTVSPAAVVADGLTSATITVVVRNKQGGSVGGKTVVVSATGASNVITQPAGPTDGMGTVTATIVSTAAELKTITATVNPGPGELVLDETPSVQFLADAGNLDAAQSSVTVSPSIGVIANDVELATISVTVRDVNSNPVPGQTVQIASDGSNNTIVQPAGPTDANGQATATIATITAETKTITATVNPGPSQVVLNDMPTVQFLGDPATIDAMSSAASASPDLGVIADGLDASTITVTVRDVNGNPVGGQAVQVAATGTNNTLTQPAGPTDANGQATATLSTTTAETKDIAVTINPGPGQTILLSAMPTVEFIGDPATIDAGVSTATASRTTDVIADGVDASVITITVRDVNGNPVGGQMVQLDATGSDYSITPSLFATDAAGQVLADFTSTVAEVKTLTMTVNPGPGQVVLNDTPAVEFFGDPSTLDALTSSAVASPTMGVIANGVDTSTITVIVRDVNGNPVAGQLVQVDSSGANNTITPVASLSDAAGQATATLATTTSETKTITVTVNPGPGQVVLADMPTIVFGADPSMISAALSSAVASPATGVVSDGSELSTVTVTVRDVNGNPLASQMVQIASTGTGNTLTQPTGPTDAGGQATATIASTTSETKTITVTVNPGPSQVVLAELPTVEFVADPSTINALLSSAVASPATGVVADDVDTSTITVTVRDANGNPVAGQTVQVAATGSDNTLTQPAGPTDANGVATAALSTITAETKTITVTVNPGPSQVVLSDTPTVDFVGDPTTINSVQSSAVASPATGVLADGVTTSTITVTVRDVNGNPVVGQTVQIAATGTNNTLTQPAGPTDAAGQASATIATTTAETKTVSVMVNPGPSEVLLSDMPTVEFIGDASTIDAALSSAVANPATGVVADDVETSTITVTVRDLNGNPVAGQTVQIASIGTNNTLTQPAGPTDANGVATATISTTTAETKTITVTVNPGPGQVVLSDMPAITFESDPSTIDAAASSAVASPATGVIADDVDASTITVTVRDANNNPVAGQLVQIAASGTNNTLTQPAALTDASGQAMATISTTTAETKTITVTVNPGPGQVVLSDMPTVAFVGDPATIDAFSSSATASPATGVVADDADASTITVTVRDLNGNPVAGQTVQIASTGTNNTLVQPAGPTDAGGQATATIATTTAETKTITVTVNPGPSQVVLADMPTVAFEGDSSTIDAANSSATASPATAVVADDVDTSTITVTVRDVNGNPVAGQTVQIASTGTNNTLVQPAGPTDASGQALATIATTTAETKTITVTVNPGPSQVVLADMPTVAFEGDPATIDAANSSATASPATGVVADGSETSTVTITVRDANNNAVPGQLVQIAASGSNNTLTQPAALTDAGGQATATIATTTAETKTITVTVNPGPGQVVLGDMPQVAFVGDPSTVDAATSSASASPTSGVVADDVDASTVTITVRDVNGNPVAGQTVQIASTGTNNTLTQPAGPTGAGGQATATIASTTAETKTITVTVNPGPGQVVLSDMPTVAFEGDPSTIDAATSSASASPTSGVIADDVDASTITVTVRDLNGNPVAGQTVQIASTGTNNTLAQPAGPTDANGMATATISTITAETKTITVTVNPGPSQVILGDMPTVDFVGDTTTINSVQSSAVASPDTGVVADGATISTITVTVRDINGNPVAGQTVQIAATGTNNTLTQPAGPTDAAGQATATLATTTAETKTVAVTVNPGPTEVLLSDMPTVAFVGDPSSIDAANSSAAASPASGLIADDVDASTITVVVRDVNGNPVAGQTVQVAATGTNNTLTQPAGSTDANGMATATLSTITAETKTITVTVNPGPSQVVLSDTPTVAFEGDPSTIDAANSSATASPATGVIADDVDASTVTITVRDANNNPVAGQLVQIAASGSNNTLTQPAALTDASGQASASITSTSAETKTITVTVNPGPGQVVLADTPTVAFVGDPSTINAATSSAAASPATGLIADDVDASTITVTVRDVNGNPVAGQTVQIASTGTNNTLVQPAGPTDAGGQATATIATTTAETKTITVTVNPGPSQVVLADMPTVAFEGDSSTIDAANSSATASPATAVVADDVDTSTITVTVRDVNGNPVAGQTVQIASTGTNNTLVQPAGPTDASGQALATIATTTAETKTITVTVNPGPSQVVLADMPTVAFEGDPATIDAANSSATASPATGVVADGSETSTVTITVRDANNNAVPGQLVQIAASGSNNTLTQPAALTDAGGQATATIATTTAETKTITVTVNPGPSQIVLADTPTVAFVGDPSTVDAATSSASASPTSGVVADDVDASTITVTVRDVNGNPVAGQTVQIASTGTNNTLTQPAGPTDASGQATATIATTTAETKTVTVTVNPGPGQVVLADMPTVVFEGDPSTIDAANSSATASPATGVVADDVETSTVTITVRDANNNPVAGQTVQIAATGSNNTLTQPAGPTDANGMATATISTITAETKTITVTVNPGPSQVILGDMPTVDFVGDTTTINSVQSSAVASPDTGVVADGATISTITVTVRDINGNPVAGQTVQIAATGTNNTLTQPAGPTDAAGQATATLATTTAETKTVAVTVNPGPTEVLLSNMPTVAFVGDPSTIDAANSSATASPATGVVADDVATSTLTVTVRDANNNPVAGQTVQVAATGTNNTLTQPAGPTDASGQATATLSTTTAETKTITVTVNPGPSQVVLSDTPTVAFEGDPSTIDAANSSATASPATGVIADDVDASTVTITVRDANNNPVAGQLVQVAATGTNNTITQPAALTDASGQTTATIATTTAETKTITVTVNPGPSQIVLADTPTVAFVGDPSTINAASSSATASPATGLIADDVDASTITVTVRDVNGNPVAGQTVQIASDGTNNTLTQPAGPTDAAGQATATIATITAETKTVTVTVNPGPSQVVLADMPTVAFEGDPSTINAANSSAAASPATGVVADDVATSTVTVTVRDANNNPVAGQTVQVAATGTNNTLTQPAGPTDANGMATATLSTITAETKTITVTVNPGPSQVVLSDMPTVAFVGDPSTIDALLSTASASPATGLIADDVETSTVTVTVLDVNSNPVAGQTVQIASTGSNNTLTQPAGPTDASGQATATISSTTAETKTISVTINPGPTQTILLSDMPTVEFVGDPSTINAATSSATASPTTGVVADDVETSTVTVTVRDVNGNPVAGQTVQIASDGTNNTLTQPAGTTDASGQATATIATLTAETKTITVTVNPGPSQVVLTDMPTVAFEGDPATIDAANSSASASPATGVIADGVETSTITVTVRDVNNNPVAGQTVQIASDGTNNTLTQPAGPTDAAGQATATISTTTAETKTITVTVNPGPGQVVLTAMPTVAFEGDPSTIDATNSSATASPTTGVVADDIDTSTITVTVRDANNNPVAGQTVQIASDGTNNTLTQPAGPTDAAGQATATIATTTAETKTITVTVNPGPSQVVLTAMPTVAFVSPVSAANSSAVTSPASGILADGTAVTTITVTVRDSGNNPIAGQTVQLAATGVENTLTQPASTTDAGGVATGTLATIAAELKTITVTVNPGPGQVVLNDTPQAEFVWPQANTYYVRVSGSDGNSGTSPADAWQTIGMAATSVAAGDTVYVGAGTYNEAVVITTDGTAMSPITFVADGCGYTGDPGEVIVDGGGANQTFHVDGADYVVIDGFTITGAAPGVGAGGAILAGSTAATNVTIRNNTIYGNDRGIYVWNVDAVTIENNRISNNTGTSGDGIIVVSADNATILDNLVYNNARYGILVESTSLNLLVESNTLYANADDQVHSNGGLNTVTLRNNIVNLGSVDGFDFVDGSTGTSTYNIVWGNTGVDWNGLVMGAGDQNVDPALVDPDGADNLLGGAQGADDQFQLDSGLPSLGLDAGSTAADAIGLSSGGTLADRTSRTDEVLDGTAPDGATVNLGYHYAVSQTSLSALDTDDARLFFGLANGGQVSARTWDDSAGSWGARGSGPPVGADLQWTVNRISPLANAEEFVAVLSDTGTAGVLDLLHWNGVCWTEEWSSSAIDVAHADKRGFDLELEASSSDAMVVYSNNTATPVYRTRTDGVWGAETSLPLNDGAGPNPDPNSGIVLWIELAQRPGTDELALVYVDANDDLVAMIWDGTQWLTASATLLESNVKTNPISGDVHNRAFDAAYENGGDLMVAWSRIAAFGFRYSTKAAGSTTFTASTPVTTALPNGVPHFVDLAAEPGGDRIAGGFFDMGDGTERLGLSVWNGTAWVGSGQYDTQILDVNDTATGDFQGAVGWVGTSGVAVCVYADNQTGTLDWARWNGTAWSLQSDVAIAGKGNTESVFIESFGGQDALMLMLSDSNSDLYSATYDGTTWTVLSSGAALETTLSSIDTAPFGFAVE